MRDRPLTRLALVATLAGMRRLGRLNAGLLRWASRVIGTRWFGAPVLVLETRGRRWRRPRHTPLVFAQHRGEVIVFAAGGTPAAAWWDDLEAGGRAMLRLGTYGWAVAPRVLHGHERAEAWRALAGVHPHVDRHRATGREPAVIALRDLREDWPAVSGPPGTPAHPPRCRPGYRSARPLHGASRTRRAGRPACG